MPNKRQKRGASTSTIAAVIVVIAFVAFVGYLGYQYFTQPVKSPSEQVLADKTGTVNDLPDQIKGFWILMPSELKDAKVYVLKIKTDKTLSDAYVMSWIGKKSGKLTPEGVKAGVATFIKADGKEAGLVLWKSGFLPAIEKLIRAQSRLVGGVAGFNVYLPLSVRY